MFFHIFLFFVSFVGCFCFFCLMCHFGCSIVCMFSLHTLPWYWKVFILAYDVAKCWQETGVARRDSEEVYKTVVHVFFCQVLLAVVLLGPSIFLSVKDRFRTNSFVSEMLLMLSIYLLLIRFIATKTVAPENACFCLQFCSCYFFYCYINATQKHGQILLAKSVVRTCSFTGMVVFPVLFSHLPPDGLHLSPYVLLFLFAGELSGCLCSMLSSILTLLESVIDSVYKTLL